jgi:hypothetical protein
MLIEKTSTDVTVLLDWLSVESHSGQLTHIHWMKRRQWWRGWILSFTVIAEKTIPQPPPPPDKPKPTLNFSWGPVVTRP